jgi:DnaJ-class molecular chaperone
MKILMQRTTKKKEEQELYKFFMKLKRKNIRPEELLDLIYPASKSAIKAACMKYIQEYHPDRFNYDQKLREMATEVTKILNIMRH